MTPRPARPGHRPVACRGRRASRCSIPSSGSRSSQGGPNFLESGTALGNLGLLAQPTLPARAVFRDLPTFMAASRRHAATNVMSINAALLVLGRRQPPGGGDKAPAQGNCRELMRFCTRAVASSPRWRGRLPKKKKKRAMRGVGLVSERRLSRVSGCRDVNANLEETDALFCRSVYLLISRPRSHPGHLHVLPCPGRARHAPGRHGTCAPPWHKAARSLPWSAQLPRQRVSPL